VRRHDVRHHRFRSLVPLVLLFLLNNGCDAGAARHRDVLKEPDGSSSLEFNQCQVGTGHYAGVTPFDLTGTTPIHFEAVRLNVPPDSVNYSAQVVYHDGSGYIGGFDGDDGFRFRFSHLKTQPVKGTELRPGREEFYLLVRVEALKPGRITVESIELDYRIKGRPATHTFPFSLVLNDYPRDPKTPECRGS
jgi:hypothetical protein